MRVAVGGLHHETNTFASNPADQAAFDAAGVLRAEQVVAGFDGSHHTIGGFLRACASGGVDVVPLLYANVWPCGEISAAAFEGLVDELLRGLAEAGPFDVVLLAQHGAAVAQGHPDADAELVARVRAAVGPDVTIGLALDLHANVTPRLLDAVDVTVGYRENPHRDAADRGAECATLALRHAAGAVRPVQRLVRLPMVVPILGGWTGDGEMRAVIADAQRIAERHGLLSATVFHGFGYADVPQLGSSVLAVADGDPLAAERASQEIAARLWDARERLRGAALEPSVAVAEADRLAGDGAGGEPVVLLDVGDNIGGGSPGDSTVLLAEALARGVPGFVATLCDPRAVEEAAAAGLDGEVRLTVGATTPASVGPRLEVAGRVRALTDGRFEDATPVHGGFNSYDGGPTARVTTAQGQELVISSRVVPTFTPQQLRAVGIEPGAPRVIVAKGVVAPRAGYEPVTSTFLLADTPGVTAADLSGFAYRRRPAPLWPLDASAAAPWSRP